MNSAAGQSKLRVLVAAFAFSPSQGSEGGIGWNLVTRLARFHEVTVLVGDLRGDLPGKHNLEQWFASNPEIPNLEVIHVPPDRRMVFWEKVHRLPGLWPLYYHAYALWQKAAYRKARELHHRRNFDLCHQLTYLTYRDPGHLWKLGIPFYWGPVSGTDNIPSSFYPMLRAEEHGKFWIRDLLNCVQKHTSFRARAASRLAKKVWCVSKSDLALIGGPWGGSAEQLFATGTEPMQAHAKKLLPGEPLRIIWSGLHIGRKALPLLLRALADIPLELPWHLEVLGNGPSTIRWKGLSDELGLPRQRIQWIGHLPKTEAIERMRGAHVLVHSSLNEGTPTVMMEALSLGLPVICHDACGMSAAVTEECGVKVPLRDPATSILGFRAAIISLLEKPDLLERLSSGALSRSVELSWDSTARAIADSYSNPS
jgi:glycosyltransferase involved in cell wall biosynthesis